MNQLTIKKVFGVCKLKGASPTDYPGDPYDYEPFSEDFCLTFASPWMTQWGRLEVEMSYALQKRGYEWMAGWPATKAEIEHRVLGDCDESRMAFAYICMDSTTEEEARARCDALMVSIREHAYATLENIPPQSAAELLYPALPSDFWGFWLQIRGDVSWAVDKAVGSNWPTVRETAIIDIPWELRIALHAVIREFKTHHASQIAYGYLQTHPDATAEEIIAAILAELPRFADPWLEKYRQVTGATASALNGQKQ